MQECVPPRGWIERRSDERRRDANTPIRILGPLAAPMVSPLLTPSRGVEFG